MILKKILEIVINLILGAIGKIPSIDPTFYSYLETGLGYLPRGIDLLAAFVTPTAMQVIGGALIFLVAAHAVYFSYSVIMWFIAKIPTMSGR